MPAPLWALSRISSNDMIPSLPPDELGSIYDATAGLGTWGVCASHLYPHHLRHVYPSSLQAIDKPDCRKYR